MISSESDKQLVVAEIFSSIQGESTWVGCLCAFIRLAGCNLRCRWCDTTYAQEGGTPLSISEIVRQVCNFRVGLVEITGGEPLQQSASIDLAAALLRQSYTVLLETNGTLSIDNVPQEVIKILDVKCPSSGMSEYICWQNLDKLGTRDEVKFVISDRKDYEWALQVIQEYALPNRCHAVLLSPAFGLLQPSTLVEWMNEDRPDARFQLQIHKYIWSPTARGV